MSGFFNRFLHRCLDNGYTYIILQWVYTPVDVTPQLLSFPKAAIITFSSLLTRFFSLRYSHFQTLISIHLHTWCIPFVKFEYHISPQSSIEYGTLLFLVGPNTDTVITAIPFSCNAFSSLVTTVVYFSRSRAFWLGRPVKDREH